MPEPKSRLSISRSRRNTLKSRYGLTPEAYTALLESQNYVCKICKRPQASRVGTGESGFWSFDVDHDHVTGRVRGLLCRDCNILLGKAKENVDTLLQAAKYLSGQ